MSTLKGLRYSVNNRSVGDVIFNRIAEFRAPETKIFFIGFNKCATSAIAKFLARQGIKSAHWEPDGENLAMEIEKRLDDPAALKRYLMRWTSYADLALSSEELMLDGNRHFRLFHELFPSAYFVLNDRDPEGWVKSRLSHRRGQFARRSAQFRGCAVEDLPAIWMEEREEHNRAALSYFADYDRFLHFWVDRDPVSNLVDFLSPSFRLKAQHWSRENVSAQRWPEPAGRP
jgi:hypothetical protein